MISWRFFSDRTDLDFHEWDFAGTTAEEAERLYGLLADQGLPVAEGALEDGKEAQVGIARETS